MFGTQMHPVTFGILFFQILVLFAQLLYVFSRPHDKSRIRFLILVIVYILYNTLSGLFPSKQFAWSIIIQYIFTYIAGISVAVYFVYYIYQEFNIRPFKRLKIGVKSLVILLSVLFTTLFIIPFWIYNDIELSRLLFLSSLCILALVLLWEVGRTLIPLYKKDSEEQSKLFKYRIVTSYFGLITLSMLPGILVFANDQCLRVSILNSGFLAMMITYIIDFIAQAKKEGIMLSQISKKVITTKTDMNMADNTLKVILERLKDFEKNQEFLKGKVTLSILSEKFETNSKYLSKIVNNYKEKPFTKYINDLRIEYVKHKLETDEKFREYKIKAMAAEIGFSSAEVFARAFYKKEKILISEYIKKVRDNSEELPLKDHL